MFRSHILGSLLLPLVLSACGTDLARDEGEAYEDDVAGKAGKADDAQGEGDASRGTPACPTAPDKASWRFGWQTVHGPIVAVWSSAGLVAKLEHVYEFRAGWGILIPSATRKNCYRVWSEREDGSQRRLVTERPGQPSSMELFAMSQPDYVVVSARGVDDGRDRVEVVPPGGAAWSLDREPTVCGDAARLVPAPDGEQLVLVRVSHGCAEPVTTGTRVTLSLYDREGGAPLLADRHVDFAGTTPWVAFDAAGSLLVGDGQRTFVWLDDGTFDELAPAPVCNPRAPTTSGPVDARGRTIFWNGGAAVISAAGAEASFGCQL